MNWNYELYKSAVTGSPLAQTKTKFGGKKKEKETRKKEHVEYYYAKDKDGNVVKKTR